MEPEGSLLCSEEPATGIYPEPDESSPCLPSYFSEIHFNIISHLCLDLPSGHSSSDSSIKTPMPAAYLAHLALLGKMMAVVSK
jgi:hypothetical protein